MEVPVTRLLTAHVVNFTFVSYFFNLTITVSLRNMSLTYSTLIYMHSLHYHSMSGSYCIICERIAIIPLRSSCFQLESSVAITAKKSQTFLKFDKIWKPPIKKLWNFNYPCYFIHPPSKRGSFSKPLVAIFPSSRPPTLAVLVSIPSYQMFGSALLLPPSSAPAVLNQLQMGLVLNNGWGLDLEIRAGMVGQARVANV